MIIGAYTLVDSADAKTKIQYPVIYHLNEAGSKRHGKALSTVAIEASKKTGKKDPKVEFEGTFTFIQKLIKCFQRLFVT